MQGSTLLLFVLLVLVALAMAVFVALWFVGREARSKAETESVRRSEQVRAAEQSVLQLQERLKRAHDGLQALRDSSQKAGEESSRLVEQWQQRYQRLAHWEGVEGHRQRELELRETVAVLERAVEALRNVIEGYGSRYVVPPQSVLDDLAREAGHTEPGQRLKEARERSRRMVKDREAAESDYSEKARAQLAADFALDAFNGKAEAILSGVKSDNIGTLQQKLKDAFTLVNEQGAAFKHARIRAEYFDARMMELKWAVRVQQIKNEEREEQRRVKEQMREEAKAQREFERAQREAQKREDAIARERALIEEARERAEREQRVLFEDRLREELARASESERVRVEAEFRARMAEQSASQRAEFEARIAETDAKLAEALAARERAKSMAQQTKRGTVYVISNVGSFGESVFKIGQTRRLDPMERIWELGDASVPFDFDVHALITTDDAPGLEGMLHEQFVLSQVNKMNWRKEFFRLELTAIKQQVEAMGLSTEWTLVAAAQQFRETQAIEQRLDQDPEFRSRWILEQRGVEFDREPAAANDSDDE